MPYNSEVILLVISNKIRHALRALLSRFEFTRQIAPRIVLWLIQLAPSVYWLADWETDMLIDWLTYGLTVWLTDWLADWLTYWLIDWLTCWLTVWPTDWLFNSLTDWLTDWLTCWETEWLTSRMTDGLSEKVMGRLVDCYRPVLLNLQANFLTMWVLPGLYHSFLTDWWWKRYG